MADGAGVAARVRADIVWAGGLAKLAELRGQGAGALIGFDRVQPARSGAFQPRRHLLVTPETLDRIISALKRWRVDIVSIDDACARIAEKTPHRFVSLSFNGAYRDVVTFAQPVLASHAVPWTVYIPSAFPDGIAEPWWLALEAVIAAHQRISLVIDRREQHFAADTAIAKHQLYDRLWRWMRELPPADLTAAISDLCVRYGVDSQALARDIGITWDGVARLAADPHVTIGSATVNHPLLANLPDAVARRDIAMGRAVLEAALQRPVRHFAYPFGDDGAFTAAHGLMARDVGLLSGVTAIPGVLGPHAVDPHRLPRLLWNSRMTLRGLRVRLAGY